MQLEDISHARVVPYERDIRDPKQPPVDGLAECVCLHACVYDPSLIDRFDLGRLVVHPEHKEIWRVLRMTRARTRHLDPARFLAQFYLDLSAEHPDKWCYYDDLLTSVGDRESARAWREYQDGDGDMPYTTFLHDFCWWLRRLQKIAEARAAIATYQQQAERLWRVPERDYTVSESLTAINENLSPYASEPLRLLDRDAL